MKMSRVTSPKVKEPAPGTWSNCRVYGNQFFVAGMTAGDGAGGVLGDGSVYSQAKETFTKIKHLVDAAGGTMNDVVRLDIYVTDIKQREEVWRARGGGFYGGFSGPAAVGGGGPGAAPHLLAGTPPRLP